MGSTRSTSNSLVTQWLLELGIPCPAVASSHLETSRDISRHLESPNHSEWVRHVSFGIFRVTCGVVESSTSTIHWSSLTYTAFKSSRRFVSAFLTGHVHDSCGAACPKCREQQICEEEVTQIIHLQRSASTDVQRCPNTTFWFWTILNQIKHLKNCTALWSSLRSVTWKADSMPSVVRLQALVLPTLFTKIWSLTTSHHQSPPVRTRQDPSTG